MHNFRLQRDEKKIQKLGGKAEKKNVRIILNAVSMKKTVGFVFLT